MKNSSSTIESTRQRLREQMPITKKWAYFDHAAVAPLSGPAHQAIQSWADEAAFEGDTVWPNWAKKLRATRGTAAEMIGASAENIALVHNTTAGINLVAEGLDWQSGDNVVTLDDEFPANRYPWMYLKRLGVETRVVPTDQGHVELDQLANYCDERTRVVSVSWVGYSNGYRRDVGAIAEIAHRNDSLFLLDAIQGLGVFPLDVVESNVDCLAADGHKWLLSPEGAGIAYLSSECLSRLAPTGVGWNSVVHDHDFSRIELDIKTTAARYEGGSYNIVGFLALGASLQLLQELGVENIGASILDFTDRAVEALTEMGANVCSPRSAAASSGIVSFELLGYDLESVRAHCREQGVALACRDGRLRVSAHAYNNEEDLAKLIDALKSAPA